MSLDVYLELPGAPPAAAGSGIFIRENGVRKEITREDWALRCPGREPVIVPPRQLGDPVVYEANITHNLGKMAGYAGLYYVLWWPDQHGYSTADRLADPLERGLARLVADPDAFKRHNPPNGWGDYDALVAFVRTYLEACRKYPDARVSVSR